MNPFNEEIKRFLEFSNNYIQKELSDVECENIDEILEYVNHYITDDIDYECLTQYFCDKGLPTHIIGRIYDIKNTDDNPIEPKNDQLDKKNTNPWSILEDNRLISGVIQYGSTNWKTISQYVGNSRTSAQCSQRWRRSLNPTISKNLWSVEEDFNLVFLVHQYGEKSWGKISSILGNRSDVQCRYHYNMISKNFTSKLEEITFYTKLQNCQNQSHTNNFGIQTFSIQNSDLKENQFLNIKIEETKNIEYQNNHFVENDSSNQNFESYSVDSFTKTEILEDQILQLQKMNKSLCQQNGRLEKRIARMQNSKDLVIRNKSMRISNLERLIERLQKEDEPKDNVIPPEGISAEFINKLIQNYGVFPSGRRYSNSFYDISYLLYLHSNITYKILRSIVPLPSEQMLHKKFKEKLTVTKENLLNSAQINVLLGEFKEELTSETDIYATLSYDSATVDDENGNNNLFVFNMQPFKGSIKSKIVQIALNSTGRTNQPIKEIVDHIIEEGLKDGIHFLFVATDAETGTNASHSDFFLFIEKLNTDDFDTIVDAANTYDKPIPVSDWYHLLKDLRGRFAKNNISMFEGAPIFNAKHLNEILNLNELVITAQGQSSMRDDIAFHLFNSANLSILALNEEFCAFAFILPYTLATIAIQSETLSTETRYIFIKLSFNLILSLREKSQKLRSRTSKKSPNINVRFAQETTCKRTLNTLIALGFALKFFDDDLAISRLFTHTVEYIFGYMRRLTYGKDKSDVAITALAKQQISKDIIKEYNIDRPFIRGRIDDKDENFNSIKSKWIININEIVDISFEQIPNEINELMMGNLNYEETETAKLMNFIEQYSPSSIPSINTRKRKGDAIRSRQQAYNS